MVVSRPRKTKFKFRPLQKSRLFDMSRGTRKRCECCHHAATMLRILVCQIPTRSMLVSCQFAHSRTRAAGAFHRHQTAFVSGLGRSMGNAESNQQRETPQVSTSNVSNSPVSPPTAPLARDQGVSTAAAEYSTEEMAAAPSVSLRRSVSRFKWTASSLESLAEAESRLLGAIGLRIFDTEIGNEQHIHTVEGGKGKSELPLVMCHGYGMGIGGWHLNLQELTSHTHVMAKDWLGCGLSSRPKWERKGVAETEDFFVDSLERWRKANGVNKMVLCGHSLGGYLSVCYAEKYPERVDKLVLASPVGFPEEPLGFRARIEERPWTQRNFIKFIGWGWDKGITPGDVVRFTGPLGYKLMMGYSQRRFASAEFDRQALGDYLYHNLASTHGSGERALSQILKPGAWARTPLLTRLPKLDPSIPIHFLFGDRDWMDSATPGELKRKAEVTVTGQRITITRVPRAGHQLFLDNPRGFNAEILRICGVDRPSAAEITPPETEEGAMQ